MLAKAASAWMLVGLALCDLAACAAPPALVKRFDCRPDRGNTLRCAFITGPTAPIHRLYNEDVEISFWNQPRALTFSVAKNDVWDRRYFGDRKQLITIDDVRGRCFSVAPPKDPGRFPGYGGLVGRNSDLGLRNRAQALYSAYDFPCPKPVGQVIIRCSDLRGHGEYVVGETANGALAARAGKGATKACVWAVLHRTRNLLVVRGKYAGATQPVRVELYRHKDTTPLDNSIVGLVHYGGHTGYDYSADRPDNGPMPAPDAGSDGRLFWVRQRFQGEKTFPKGFECAMAAAIDGPAYDVKVGNHAVGAGEKAVVHPISPAVYKKLAGYRKQLRVEAERVNHAEFGALASATLHDPASFTLYVAVVTTRDAADPLAAAKQMLADAQRAGADALIAESAAATDEGVRAWRNSRVMHYNATSCTYADATPWHGDYHFNEGYCLPDIVRGQPHNLDQRLLMFEGMRPALERNAREVYGCRGLCFPLVHYPIKHDRVVYGSVTWEWGIENTGFMLQPFWQIYQYTQDREFLRQRAYPMMREGARFYADYVTKGDDGRYHVVPTVSQEHWGFTPKFRLNRDSVGALSFVKYHLEACIQASEILGLDAAERERWREIVGHLAPYPTLDTPNGPVFCDVRDAPRLLNYNITANLVMVLWAEDISIDSPPEVLELARRSFRAIPDKAHSPRPGYLERIRLYLGMLDKPCLAPQGRVLSWPGRIHLYAGVPKGMAVRDSFKGYLAVGGFEVSGMHFNREPRRVRIKSRVGGSCKLKNPWQPGKPQVKDANTGQIVAHQMRGDTIVFDTQPGHTYAVLSPAEIARAAIRFEAQEKTIGRWTFDSVEAGRVQDQSGHGHRAELVGGAAVEAVGGGSALKLSGAGAYASAPSSAEFDFAANESFSVEAKVKIGSAPDLNLIPIVCRMATKQYCLFLRRGCARFYLSSPRGNVFAYVNGKTPVADGQWHMIRAVRDAKDAALRVYVDGRLDGEAGDSTAGDFASDAPITIGAYLWGDHTKYAQGLIDDVEIKSLGKMIEGPLPRPR